MRAFRPKAIGLFALAALLTLSGCGGDNAALPAETDEPLYREGLERKREGHTQEALDDYLKVIAKRGEQAPESHLEAGLIYLEYIQDPVAAIYHFRKYLELEPNSRQAANVRALIDTGKRNFIRTLPLASPSMESSQGQTDLLDQVNRLQRENDELKARLAGYRNEATPLSATHVAPDADSAPAPVFVSAAADVETPAAVPASGSGESASPPPDAPARARPPPPAPAQGRSYTVQPHDTLYGIAKKFYGSATNAKVQAILQANRGALPGPGALKPGMELRIP